MSEQLTSNTANPQSEAAKKLEGLTEMYNDLEWREKQDTKLIAGIEVAITTINNLTLGLTEFLSKFYQFVNDVSENPVLFSGVSSEGYEAPTQTSGNRATRRARDKK
jgi:dynactin complex subunit